MEDSSDEEWDGVDPNWSIRMNIISAAHGEYGNGIASDLAGEPDETGRRPRQGWERLMVYFHEAAPGIWPDDDIKYSDGQIPSWCGIFALWALRTGGASVGTWQQGSGIGSVSGLKYVAKPRPGDVGYFNAHQHHCIIYDVSGGVITTVDGNWGNGEVAMNTHSRSDFAAILSAV